MKKLYKNNFTVLISTLALSSSLVACTPSKINDEQMKEEINREVIEQSLKQTDNIEETGQAIAQEIKEKNKDKEIEEYITLFRQEISELGKSAKEKWDSEETQEKIKKIKQKSKDLFDFVFNGKEINGIKFKNLSDNGKEIAQNGLYELDYYIELMIPNYKDKTYDTLVNGGAAILEKIDSAKKWYDNYQEDVIEEYNSRNNKSK